MKGAAAFIAGFVVVFVFGAYALGHLDSVVHSITHFSSTSGIPETATQREVREANSPDRDWIAYLVGALILAAGVAVIIKVSREQAPVEEEPSTSGNYGTAEYARRIYHTDPLAAFNGVFLGMSSEPNRPAFYLPAAPIYTTPEAHTLIVAPTRTGKGTRIIIPTLLRYGGSMLVIDPKGENAAVTARARRDTLGQQIHVINPWGELAVQFQKLGLQSATFNPLKVIDPKDPNAVSIAQSFAATICATHGEKNPFWHQSAATLLTGILLWLADDPFLPGKKGADLLNLATVREIVSLPRKRMIDDVLSLMATSSSYDGAVRDIGGQFWGMPDETYGGVMATLAEATKFIDDPQLKAATASSSFTGTELLNEAVTVYLVIPPSRMATQGPFLKLVMSSIMHSFKRAGAEERQHRCMFLIDEFPALGHMPDIVRDIATMGGYGLDFTLIIQSLAQLKALYGESAPTIRDNCVYKWFSNVTDLETAEFLSKSLGQSTVRTMGTSISSNPGGEGSSTTYGEMGRPLMTPDELMSLGKEVAFAFNPHGKPHYLRTIDYWDLSTAFGLLRKEAPTLYWTPPMTYDRNPYVASDKQKAAG